MGSPDLIKTYYVKENTFDFSEEIIQRGKYSFLVMAIGNNDTFLNSEKMTVKTLFIYNTPYVREIVIDPIATSIKVGEQVSFTAVTFGIGKFNPAIQWSILNAKSPDTKIVDGSLTIGKDEISPEITVRATSVQTNTLYAEAFVTIQPLTKLAPPTNLKWDGQVASWDTVDNATGYKVTLFKGTEQIGEIKNTTDTKIDFGIQNEIGSDSFRVQAYGDGYLDSEIVQSPFDEIKTTKVTVTPDQKELKAGETQRFTAILEGSGNYDKTVTWLVEGAQKSKTTTIDQEGKLTLGTDQGVGTTLSIKATAKGDITKTGTAMVTVVKEKDPDPVINGVVLTPSMATITKGQTFVFKSEVTGLNTPSQEVIWQLEGHKSQGTALVDGILTVGGDENATQIIVKATSAENGNYSASATVTVSNLPKLEVPQNLQWDGKVAKWDTSAKATSYVVELYRDGQRLDVQTIKTNTVDYSDFFTSQGDYSFRVVAVGDGINHASSDQVGSPEQKYSRIISVKIEEGQKTIKPNTIATLSAEVEGRDEFNKEVNWSIISDVTDRDTKISASGELYLGKNEGATSVKLQASSVEDEDKKDTITLTVIKSTAETVSMDITDLSAPGEVTVKDRVPIANAKGAYEVLTPDEKGMISIEQTSKLSAAIEALPNVNLIVEGTGIDTAVAGMGLILTSSELLADKPVTLKFTANVIEGSDDDGYIKELAKLKNITVGKLMDLRVTKIVDGEEVQITVLESNLVLEFTIADGFKGQSNYTVLRVHNDEAAALKTETKVDKIIASSNLFSTYAIAYNKKDPEKPVDPVKPVDPTNPENPENPKSPENTTKPGNPIQPQPTTTAVVKALKAPGTGNLGGSMVFVAVTLLLLGTVIFVKKVKP